MRNSVVAIVASVLCLAACGELRWYKSGADEAALAADLSDCGKLAQQRTLRMWGVAPPATTDPRFGAPSAPSQVEMRLQESQAVDVCMRQRGYILAPA